MGSPVVHFEIMATDAERLRSYYSDLFGWEFNSDNPMNYGVVAREENLTAEGIGIGGGLGEAPAGYDGHVTVYVEVPDVEAALVRAECLGGTRMMGPDRVNEQVEIGLMCDPEGRLLGVIRSTP